MGYISLIVLCFIFSRAYCASNSCIDTNLSYGLSFSESVRLCQTSRDSLSDITTMLKPSTLFKTLVISTKGVPVHVLNPAPKATTTPPLNVHSHMPYLPLQPSFL